MMHQVYRMSRVRKALRKKLNVSDDELSVLLRQRYGVVDQSRQNLIVFVKKTFPWMIGKGIA